MKKLIGLLLIGAILLVGCSKDDDGGSGGSNVPHGKVYPYLVGEWVSTQEIVVSTTSLGEVWDWKNEYPNEKKEKGVLRFLNDTYYIKNNIKTPIEYKQWNFDSYSVQHPQDVESNPYVEIYLGEEGHVSIVELTETELKVFYGSYFWNDEEYKDRIITFTKQKDNTDNQKDIASQIKDEILKTYCFNNFDYNKDGKITQKEANAAGNIWINNTKELSKVDGIEYFSNLTTLELRSSNIETINVSNKPYLIRCWLDDSSLKKVIANNCSAMFELLIYDCPIQELDIRNCEELHSVDLSTHPQSILKDEHTEIVYR